MTQLMELEAPSTVLGTPGKELALRVHSRHNAGLAQVVLLAGQKVSIGADPQCTLRLAGAQVEPCYCFVLRGEAHDVVRSLSPRAKLNGADFQDATLQCGDRLQLDDVELEVLASPVAPERDLEAEQRVIEALAEETRQRSEGIEARFAELERQVQALRDGEARQAEAGEALERQQRELEEQRAAFAQERDAAARNAAEAAERQAAETRLRSEAVEARFAEAERLEQAQREAEGKLAADRENLERERRELDEQRARLNLERQSLEQSTTESTLRQTEELRHRAEEFAARERKLEAERQELELEVRTLHAERDQTQAGRDQFDAEQAALAADRAELQNLAKQFEAERRAVEEARAELAEGQRQLEAAKEELSARPAGNGAAGTMSGAEVRAEREREQLRQERETWEEQRQRWDRECERWERESREFQADLEERERQLQAALERLESGGALLAAAEEVAEETTTVEAPTDRRASSRSESGEDEDSIQNYMQQLLQRANVKPKDGAASAGHASPTANEVKLRTPEPTQAKPATPVERPARRPDRPKPEQAVDLSTLREIANMTAKGALDRHSEKKSAQRRLNRILLGGGGFSFGMIVLACLGIYPTITAALAVAGTAVAFLGWRQYQLSLRRFGAAVAEKPVETPAVVVEKLAESPAAAEVGAALVNPSAEPPHA